MEEKKSGIKKFLEEFKAFAMRGNVLDMAVGVVIGGAFTAIVTAQVEAGIPGDVVAAIMAAIYSMGNGKYVLKAVRRGKNGWGKAGVNDTTAPF